MMIKDTFILTLKLILLFSALNRGKSLWYVYPFFLAPFVQFYNYATWNILKGNIYLGTQINCYFYGKNNLYHPNLGKFFNILLKHMHAQNVCPIHFIIFIVTE